MIATTVDTDATASAANKTWIFKRKMAVGSQKHQRLTTATKPVGVFQVFPLPFFFLKIAIRWTAFKIGSLKAVTVTWFKDPSMVC